MCCIFSFWDHLLALPLMVFVVVGDTTAQTFPYLPEDSTKAKVRYDTYRINVNYGNLKEAHFECISNQNGRCTLADSLRPLGPNYLSAEIGFDRVGIIKQKFSKNEKTGRTKYIYLYSGWGVEAQGEFFYNFDFNTQKLRGNLFPYYRFGTNFIGVMAGLRIGNIWVGLGGTPYTIELLYLNEFDYYETSFLAASSSVRLGNPNRLYVQFNNSRSMTLGVSVAHSELAITFPLGRFTNNRFQFFRMGVGVVNSHGMISHIEAGINLSENLTLTPRLGLINKFPRWVDGPNFTRLSAGVGLYFRRKK